jgi:hypothetical protein
MLEPSEFAMLVPEIEVAVEPDLNTTDGDVDEPTIIEPLPAAADLGEADGVTGISAARTLPAAD